MKKNLKLLFSIFSVSIIIFNGIFNFGVAYIYATDTPEEIARQQQEEAQDIAQDQARQEEDAKREADKQAREAEEAVQEALRHATPTPIPDPTIAPINLNPTIPADSNTNSLNADTNNNSNSNNNSANVDNNSNTTASSGNNVISGDQPSTITITPTVTPVSNPIPTCEDYLGVANDNGGEENQLYFENGEITPQEILNNTTDTNSQDNDNLSVANTNCASVNNDQNLNATSGENSSSDNDGNADLATGGSGVNSNLLNEVNTNTTDNQDVQGSSASAELVNENTNVALVKNDVNADAVSGENDVNNNEGAKLSTGDIDMMVTLMNILNLNVTGEDFTHLIVNIFGNLDGDVDLDKIAKSLGMTEDEIQAISRSSNDENNQSENNISKTTNQNDAIAQNNVDVHGVSGANDISGNEDGSKTLTGRIKILVALLNFINTNYSGSDWYFAMVNIFGDVQGDILLPDANNFLVDSSGSSGEQNNINNRDMSSNTNQVDIKNNVSLTGDTGSNTAYANQDPVTQTTGEVSTQTYLSNFLNMNIIGNNWVLLIINVFGTWYGKIVGLPGQSSTSAPESGMLMVAAGANNGPQISSGNNENNNSSVSNDNKAYVENNVSVSGVSGANTTNQNQDPVKVSTGWVDLSADLMNIVNMNVSGKNWMLVFVNIFGSLIGDINFGPKPKTNDLFKVQEITDNDQISNTGEFEDVNNEIGNPGNNQNTLTGNNALKNQQDTNSSLLGSNNGSSGSVNDNSETIKILPKELYKAPDQNTETVNNTQVFGVSINVTSETEEILLIVSLVIYLIALQFWGINRRYILLRSIDKQ